MDGDGKNSPFTAALIKYLAMPGLDLRIAFGRVRDDVMKATSNKQEPFVYGSLGGDVVSLVPTPEPKVVAPSTATTDNIADARRDYEFVERMGQKKRGPSSYGCTRPACMPTSRERNSRSCKLPIMLLSRNKRRTRKRRR